MDQRGFTPILFILIIVVLSAGIVGSMYFFSKLSKPSVQVIQSPSSQTTTSPSPSPSPSPLPTLNAATDIQYCNNTVGFCASIPSSCQKEEIKIGQAQAIPAVEFNCPVPGQSSPNRLQIFSSVWKNDFDLNTSQYCSADVCDATDGGIFKSSRKVETINGVTYYFHITAVPTNWSYIYFTNKALLYELMYGSQDDPTVLNKILQSFKPSP